LRYYNAFQVKRPETGPLIFLFLIGRNAFGTSDFGSWAISRFNNLASSPVLPTTAITERQIPRTSGQVERVNKSYHSLKDKLLHLSESNLSKHSP